MADSLAGITTDTGDFALKRREHFSSYTDIRQCLAAALNVTFATRRTNGAQQTHDSLRMWDPVHDTTGTEVARVARDCGAKFTGVKVQVTTSNFENMFRLAVLEQDDSVINAVLQRRLAVDSTAEDSGKTLYWAVTKLLGPRRLYEDWMKTGFVEGNRDSPWGAEPSRPGLAEAAMSQLDALGERALLSRIRAHEQFVEYAEHEGDGRLLQHEALLIVGLIQQVKPTGHHGNHTYEINRRHYVWWEYSLLALKAYMVSDDSALAIARRAMEDYKRIGIKFPGVRAVLGELMDGWVDSLDQAAPRKSPPWHAAYWFPAGADTVLPVPGTLSMVIDVSAGGPLYVGDNSHLILLIDRLQRYKMQYGNKLTIILHKYIRSVRPCDQFYSGCGTAESIAQKLADFYQKYLKLNVLVAVDTIPYDPPLPDPDGRIIPKRVQFNGRQVVPAMLQVNPFRQTYGIGIPWDGDAFLITGSNGVTLFAGQREGSVEFDRMLDKWVKDDASKPSP